MQVLLNQVVVRRGDFILHADGGFCTGTHLVTGRIGSGKSLLGEVISGVQTPGSGEICRVGVSSSVLSMQFPEYHITTTTVAEEASSWGLDLAQVLPVAGLDGRGDDDILTLSRGELKRLHLACLLAKRFDLMVLDEPFAGLDEEARYQVAALLDSCRDRIVIIISHDVTTLPAIDHIWEMADGDLRDIGQVPSAILSWDNAPPLIRYLTNHGISLNGLAWSDLAEAVCRIPE